LIHSNGINNIHRDYGHGEWPRICCVCNNPLLHIEARDKGQRKMLRDDDDDDDDDDDSVDETCGLVHVCCAYIEMNSDTGKALEELLRTRLL
jgi:hypothetical protein